MANNTVFSILQDSQGFVWLGTESGLNRYDGKSFKTFMHHPFKVNTLSGNWIQCLYEDPFGMIWIGTRDNGLNRFDPSTGEFHRIQHDPEDDKSLSNDLVWAITSDDKGNLWVGTKGGLNRLNLTHYYQTKNARFEHITKTKDGKGLSSNVVGDILIDDDGLLWLATWGGGINIYNPEKKQVRVLRHIPDDPFSLPNDKVKTMLFDGGRLWVGTHQGLCTLNLEDGRFRRLAPGEDGLNLSEAWINSLGIDKKGDLWVGTYEDGLMRVPATGNRVIKYYAEEAHNGINANYHVSAKWIGAIYTDRTGIVWIGSGRGVHRFYNRDKEFLYYRDPLDKNRLSSIKSLYVDSKDNLWAAPWGRGLVKYSRSKGSFDVYTHDDSNPQSISSNIVRGFAEDDEYLWLATNNGLNRMDVEKEVFKTYNLSNSDLELNQVSYILKDRDNQFWLGSWGQGINIARVKSDDTLDITIFKNNDTPTKEDPASLSGNNIRVIIEDPHGNIWVGTKQGLSRLTRTRNTYQVKRYRSNPDDPHSLSHNDVCALYMDSDSRLWVGTSGGGLSRMNLEDETFTQFSFDKGIPSNNIQGIVGDIDKNLWLITKNAGIACFNPETEELRLFGSGDGLQSDEFEAAYYQTQYGEIFIGGHNGINSFFPRKIRTNQSLPPVVLTSFKKFNEESPLEKEFSVIKSIHLDWRDSVVSFEFAALDYHIPEKNRYAYRLDDFDQKWLELGNENVANFTNIPPGSYTLRVKASNNDGMWNNDGLALKIYMAPPPWRSIWAYILYVLTIIAIIWRYMHLQAMKLEQERYVAQQLKKANEKLKLSDRIKDQFLANTSHELRTPLNGMIGLADSMIHGATGELTQLQKDNLALIMTSGQRLSKLVNDILDYSKMRREKITLHLHPVSMREQVEVVLSLNKPLAREKNITITNLISENMPPVEADPDRLKQVLHNLIGNAVKFTEEGRVEVTAEAHMDMLTVSIHDTGIGIDANGMERIFESFEQVDGSAGREYGGTGLGLAITKSIIELHGGEITAMSEPGKGSCFSFSIPLADLEKQDLERPIEYTRAAPDEESTMILAATRAMQVAASMHDSAIPEPIQHDEEENWQGYRILLVDDEPVNLQVLRNMLCMQSYDLFFCASGYEALSALEDQSFDLILLDVMMPKLSGFETCQQIRMKHPPDELPIIMLTAKNQVGDVVTGFEVGANDYVVKPVSQDELLVRLRTHLELLKTSRKLRESKQKLEEYSHSLEEKVRNRTLEIHNRNKELEALDDIVKTINQEVELNNLLSSLLREAHVLFHNVEKGLFIVHESDGEKFRVAAVDGYSEQALGMILSWEDLVKWYGVEVDEVKAPVHIIDSFNDQDDDRRLTYFPPPACSLVMTVSVKSRVEGFLILDNLQDSGAFEETDLHRLDRLQAHAVSAIVKARMLEEVKRKNDELMKAQKQLIMQEKMAYLGNLTAGVAHEIKNPLNFVNNFATIAVDMTKEIRELLDENALMDPPDMTIEEKVKEALHILDDLEQNTSLIYQHGKRADRVVHSMMMHSKTGLREKQAINLNLMLEEQYELAFHAVYALGNSIEIEIEQDFDKSLTDVVVVPHEMSRALLNIINNAIYALIDRQREDDSFQPKIVFKTRDCGDSIQIWIRDNGIGIAPEFTDKIFTPFFSTKPTGEGIGLGLSISYDIIVQGHQGQLEVKSTPYDYCEFMIKLPRKYEEKNNGEMI